MSGSSNADDVAKPGLMKLLEAVAALSEAEKVQLIARLRQQGEDCPGWSTIPQSY
jgi:hypothetical protein